jgi:hypothetical protein
VEHQVTMMVTTLSSGSWTTTFQKEYLPQKRNVTQQDAASKQKKSVYTNVKTIMLLSPLMGILKPTIQGKITKVM